MPVRQPAAGAGTEAKPASSRRSAAGSATHGAAPTAEASVRSGSVAGSQAAVPGPATPAT